MTKRPQSIERMVALGTEAEGTSPQVFAAQLKEETEKWRRIHQGREGAARIVKEHHGKHRRKTE